MSTTLTRVCADGLMMSLRALTQLQEPRADFEGRFVTETVPCIHMYLKFLYNCCNCNLGSFMNLTTLELRIGCIDFTMAPCVPKQLSVLHHLRDLPSPSLRAAWEISTSLNTWLAPLTGLTTLALSVAQLEDGRTDGACAECIGGLRQLRRVEVSSREAGARSWLPGLLALFAGCRLDSEYVACGSGGRSMRRRGIRFFGAIMLG